MKTVDTVLAAVRPGVSEVPKPAGTDLVAAINQGFAEFELAYHNQFHKAFAAEGSLPHQEILAFRTGGIQSRPAETRRSAACQDPGIPANAGGDDCRL